MPPPPGEAERPQLHRAAGDVWDLPPALPQRPNFGHGFFGIFLPRRVQGDIGQEKVPGDIPGVEYHLMVAKVRKTVSRRNS